MFSQKRNTSSPLVSVFKLKTILENIFKKFMNVVIILYTIVLENKSVI